MNRGDGDVDAPSHLLVGDVVEFEDPFGDVPFRRIPFRLDFRCSAHRSKYKI